MVPANSLDFAVSYDLDRHATLVFSATNLRDDNFRQHWGSGTSRPRDIRFQDRTFGLGVRLKL